MALLLLGAWLGTLLASWAVATINLGAADRVLGPGGRPELAEKLAAIGSADRRTVLRHFGAELNRWIFRVWTAGQFGLGLAVLALLWPRGGLARWLSALALVVVLGQLATLAALTEKGRALDFVPRPLPPGDARVFGALHATFMGLDVLKAGSLLGTALVLLRRP